MGEGCGHTPLWMGQGSEQFAPSKLERLTWPSGRAPVLDALDRYVGLQMSAFSSPLAPLKAWSRLGATAAGPHLLCGSRQISEGTSADARSRLRISCHKTAGGCIRWIQAKSSRLGSRGGAPILNRLEVSTGWSLRQSRLQTGAVLLESALGACRMAAKETLTGAEFKINEWHPAGNSLFGRRL